MDGVCRGAALSFKENFKKYNNNLQQKKRKMKKPRKFLNL